MENTYWSKQGAEPLFPEILWSRPEHSSQSGKLAVIGGNSQGFGAVGIAYNEALSAGVGVCKVLMPEEVRKTVKYVLPDAGFAPSNRSGSFAREALGDFLQIADWADAVLLSGDFGRNSETAVLLEDFAEKYSGLLTVTHDALDYFKAAPKELLNRKNTLLVASLSQLQKIFINLPLITPITYSMSLNQLAEALHKLTLEHSACIVVKHNDAVFVSENGRVASTLKEDKVWRVKTAARASVFWLQNPAKTLESTTTSLT